MTIRTMPATIDKTGTNEVGAALTAWIHTGQPGDTMIWPDYGIFRSDRKPVSFNDTEGLTHEGNGSKVVRTIKKPYPASPLDKNGNPVHDANYIANRTLGNFDLTRTKSSVIRDLHASGCNNAVEQTRDDTEAQHGWNVVAAEDVELDDCGSDHTWGDTAYFGMDEGFTNHQSRNIYVNGGGYGGAGRQGISLTGIVGLRYEPHLLAWVMRTLIDIEPNSPNKIVDQVVLRPQILGAHHLTFLSSGGLSTATVGRIELSGAFIKTGTCMMLLNGGDSTHRRGPYVITDLTAGPNVVGFGSPSGALILIRNANGAEIARNRLPVQADRDMYGVKATAASNAVVHDNVFANAVGEFQLIP